MATKKKSLTDEELAIQDTGQDTEKEVERSIKLVWPVNLVVRLNSGDDEFRRTFKPGMAETVPLWVYDKLISQTKQIDGCCGGVGKRVVNLFTDTE